MPRHNQQGSGFAGVPVDCVNKLDWDNLKMSLSMKAAALFTIKKCALTIKYKRRIVT